MFIYFWEQVWQDEMSVSNWITEEIGRRFWENWHDDNRGSTYFKEHMKEGIDYVEY